VADDVPDGIRALVRERVESEMAAIPAEQRPDEATLEQLHRGQRRRASAAPAFRSFVTFDPQPYLRRLTVPTLALYGDLDLQVPAEQSEGPMREALAAAGNPDATVITFPGLNHLMQPAVTGGVDEYGAHRDDDRPDRARDDRRVAAGALPGSLSAPPRRSAARGSPGGRSAPRPRAPEEAGMDPVVTVEGLRKAYGDVTAADDVTFDVRAARCSAWSAQRGRQDDDPGVRHRAAPARRRRVRVLGSIRSATATPCANASACSCRRPRCPTRCASARPSRCSRRSTRAPATPPRRCGASASTTAVARACGDLSGGQRQRLFIALALVHEPEVVLLDELTTGLDPQARRDAWALVREIRERGATVILTTHFMEEAERLCDRVAIVDRGRIVALDTVGRLIASLGEERRVTFVHEGAFEDERERGLRGLPGVVRVERLGDRVIVSVRGVGTAGAGDDRAGGGRRRVRRAARRAPHPRGRVPGAWSGGRRDAARPGRRHATGPPAGRVRRRP
jgi:ABC-2 type transport system ATP-binding protein